MDAGPDAPGGKAQWREWAKQVRAGLDLPAISSAIRSHLVRCPAWESARTILLYAPLPAEIDLLPLAVDRDRLFLVPRCLPQRRLAVHRFDPETMAWTRGPFGVREPDPLQVPEEDPGRIDLVVAPALAIDDAGVRLGYGGGYYDRFLAGPAARAHHIGVVPESLRVHALPRDNWDISLQGVCSEAGFLPITNGGTEPDMV
ncbi:MAG: 5-formyltetrahydrofolate cyclo-ligase [Armatimonadota bacterium]